MTEERRRHQRFAQPLDGSWTGASGSGTGRCRIADISVGGCFIESLAAPGVGETAVITVSVGEHSLAFTGDVLYIEPNMGFAVKFRPIPADHMNSLLRFLRSLEGPAE